MIYLITMKKNKMHKIIQIIRVIIQTIDNKIITVQTINGNQNKRI